MFLPLARVALVVIAATLIASLGGAQQPEFRNDIRSRLTPEEILEYELLRKSPSYTAFPEIAKPLLLIGFKNPDGTTELTPVKSYTFYLPPLPALAPDAPPFRKVRHEQLREGLVYLARNDELIRTGVSIAQLFREYTDMVMEVYRAGAELEDAPAKRVRWYEARIRKFKEFEWFTLVQVANGNYPPERLPSVRFDRLRAEVELLELLAEVHRTRAVPVPFPMVPPKPPANDRVNTFANDGPDKGAISSTSTAFPDLKPPETDASLIPVPPEVPTDAPPLRKVRAEQTRQGFGYLAHISELIRTKKDRNLPHFHDTMLLTSEVYVVAAETEDKLADRVPWYEERVRKLKELERFTETRVRDGTTWPSRLNQIRFYRLQAELDLLTLKDEVAREGKKTGRPLKMVNSQDFPRTRLQSEDVLTGKQRPFTAFPDIKPATIERKTVTTPEGKTEIVFEEKGAVPLPPWPTIAADAPLLGRLHFEQLQEGRSQLDLANPHNYVGRDFFDWGELSGNHVDMIAKVYRRAAELEAKPAKRMPWYEARVREFKAHERLTAIRVVNGNDPPHRLNQASFERLRAEAELLNLTAEPAPVPTNTEPAPIPLYVWPPACVRPRGGLLPRLFHRR